MAVRVPEVDASPSTAGVDLPILQGTRPASIRDAGSLDPVEDRVKFCIAHVKRIVVALKPVASVEVQRQSVVHPHGREVPHGLCTPQTENIREELCRGFLVVCGHNGVVQCNSHKTPPVCHVNRKSTRLNSSHLGISYAVFC